jgi:hypothetical protein
MPRAVPFSTLPQRIAWFLAHPSFLSGKVDMRALVKDMKRDGLLSHSTYHGDVNLDAAIAGAKRLRNKRTNLNG